MVRFTVLASGSKGNSTVVSGGRTRILVDAGLSCRELFRRMKLAEEAPETLDAIVITHEHQDHVNGLAVTARKLGIPVYFTEATHRAWMRWLTPRRQMTYKLSGSSSAVNRPPSARPSRNLRSWKVQPKTAIPKKPGRKKSNASPTVPMRPSLWTRCPPQPSRSRTNRHQ